MSHASSRDDQPRPKRLDSRFARDAPDDVLRKTFGFLDFRGLCAAEVDKRWSRLARERAPWRVLFRRRYGQIAAAAGASRVFDAA